MDVTGREVSAIGKLMISCRIYVLTVQPYVAIDLAKQTINFDRLNALCIQKPYHRPQFTVGGCCNDATVRTREVPLVHASCDVIIGMGSDLDV